LGVVRRQAKVAAARQPTTFSEPVAGTSRATTGTGRGAASSKDEQTSRDVVVKGAVTVVMVGQRKHDGVAKKQNCNSLSKAQINVVKTMVYVTVCFVVCWMPFYITVVYKTLSVKFTVHVSVKTLIYSPVVGTANQKVSVDNR